ncbi:MAG: hypothetical protein QOC62_426 [Mycobacterium sp.]|jgi:hypothetical protein|nr:hypothetical protein [Mycobacterium sp.]
MTTITRHLAVALRVISWLALATAIVAAPAGAILENPGSAGATPTASTQPVGGTPRRGPDSGPTTGGAPSAAEASTSPGSHKHLGPSNRCMAMA